MNSVWLYGLPLAQGFARYSRRYITYSVPYAWQVAISTLLNSVASDGGALPLPGSPAMRPVPSSSFSAAGASAAAAATGGVAAGLVSAGSNLVSPMGSVTADVRGLSIGGGAAHPHSAVGTPSRHTASASADSSVGGGNAVSPLELLR